MMEIKGLDALIKKTENLAADARKDTQTALNDFADRVASGAKQLVASNSSDEGKLLGSINAKYGDLSASVVVGANYAAFIEFGTRKFAASYVASLPQDWKTFAATFRGKSPDGGTFDDFVQAIMAWVQRKGIGARKTKSGNNSGSRDSLSAMQSAAYAIALNILQNGIRPKPFLYPSVEKETPVLLADLKDIFK